MRFLICGDRTWNHYEVMRTFIAGLHSVYEDELVIIEGEAKGADIMAGEIAAYYLPEENVLRFPADWTKYGRAAGPIRNKQMLDEGKPDVIVAFHDNIIESKGTKNMLEQGKKAGVEGYVIGKF